jgi:outer membrane protein TolC
MRKKLLVLFGLFLVFKINAQNDPKYLSLEEAIDYALEHNRTSKNASRDIEAARKQKWETIATGLPQVDGAVAYQDFLKQQVQVVPSDFSDPNSDLVPVIFGAKKNINASATLSQLLFDGSYLVGLQSAKVFLEISKNAKTKTDLEVRKAVINAYGNVILAKESVEILEKNQNTLQKNLDELTKIYENGLEEEESVEQLKITLSSIESNLNNAKRLRSIAYKMLNLTLGLDIETNVVLTDDLKTLTLQNIDLDYLNQDYSVEASIDYQIAENDKRAKELLVKLEQSRLLPTLSSSLTGGYTSFSNTFDFLNSDKQYFGYALLGINLQIPIFGSGLKSARTQRAKINLEKSKDELTETEQRLKLEIASAKSDYQYAIEDFSERIEEKNEVKFFEGISSSFDLRQAQTQLYTAQQEYLQAMLDVITKKAELETLLNTPN